MRRVIITGSNGQDGHLLAKLHLSEGDLVYGITRRNSSIELVNHDNFRAIVDPELLIDRSRLLDFISNVNPTHIYHLASVHGPSGTMGDRNNDEQIRSVGIVSTQNIAEALLKINKKSGFTVALSSRMYSENLALPIDETTPLTPSDFYGETKMKMRELVNDMRETNGLNAGSAILFNHDSIHKSRGYLSWDIAKELVKIVNGEKSQLNLKNPQLEGDFSHANDIVRGLFLQSQENNLTDYVFGSGGKKSIAKIVQNAAQKLGIKNIDFEYESSESKLLPYSNIQKASSALNWAPEQRFESAIEEMVYKLKTELIY